MPIEVFSDVVCPWCYIGKRRLEEALSRLDHADQVTITYRSFQLDPSIRTPWGRTQLLAGGRARLDPGHRRSGASRLCWLGLCGIDF